ncbi:MAG: tetratricopeptide repeat protein [Anaerolineaceae bacterium]
MKRKPRLVFLPLILFPLVAMLVFQISPVTNSVREEIAASLQALEDGQPRIAAVAAEKAAKQVPWRGDLWASAGRYALASNDAGRALKDFEQAQKRGNLDSQSLVEMGDAYWALNQKEEAVQAWQQAVEQGYIRADLYNRLATAYEEQGNLEAARTAWQRSVDLNPKAADARYRLGLLTAINDPEAGLTFLLQAARDDPALSVKVRSLQTDINAGLLEGNPAYTLVTTGRGLGQIGEWQLAAAAFETATQQSPAYADAWAYYGAALEQTGTDGLPALEKAVTLDAKSVSAQALMAVYWQNHKDYDKALVYLQALAEQQPENSTWQIEIGRTVAEQGEISSALPYFEQAVTLDPKSVTPRQALITFCLQYDFMVSTKALPAVRELVSQEPHDATSLDLGGQVYFALGDTSTARRFIQRALEEEPNFYLAHLHLGVVLLAEGDRKGAYSHLMMAADPGADEAVRTAALRVIQQQYR